MLKNEKKNEKKNIKNKNNNIATGFLCYERLFDGTYKGRVLTCIHWSNTMSKSRHEKNLK